MAEKDGYSGRQPTTTIDRPLGHGASHNPPSRQSKDRTGATLTEHLYISTWCQHGHHTQCRLTCKLCDAACLCPCHCD